MRNRYTLDVHPDTTVVTIQHLPAPNETPPPKETDPVDHLENTRTHAIASLHAAIHDSVVEPDLKTNLPFIAKAVDDLASHALAAAQQHYVGVIHQANLPDHLIRQDPAHDADPHNDTPE